MAAKRKPKTHVLKTWPEFFQPTWDGDKEFEVRVFDRDFEVDDLLVQEEWDPEVFEAQCVTIGEREGIADVKLFGGAPLAGARTQAYTGRWLSQKIKYILASGFGLEEGHGVLGCELRHKRGGRFRETDSH